MQIKVKSLLFGISLFFNFSFILLLIVSLHNKNVNISYFYPDGDYVTAAAIISVPQDSTAAFDLIEIKLKPHEKAYLQFSYVFNMKQSNLLINTLYDPQIIKIMQTGYGIEIIGLSEGFTLMQALTADGIKDIALIIVEK